MGNWGEYQSIIREIMLPGYARASAENYAFIKADFERGDCDVASLPHREGPGIVLGSGPSLDDAIEFLKVFPGPIFASASQLNILEHHHIVPDYVILADNADVVAQQIGDRLMPRTTLVAHPSVSPLALRAWKGRRAYYRISIGGEWDFTQACVYPWIRASIAPLGSVVPASIQVADIVGCSPIILAGVDFSFIGGRYRATDYARRAFDHFMEIPDQAVPDRAAKEEEMQGYRNNLLALWKTRKYPLVQLRTRDESALLELPQWTMDGPFPDQPDPETIEAIVDDALAPEGISVVIGPDGDSSIEYAPTAPEKEKRHGRHHPL
jgi:hypothetical protein